MTKTQISSSDIISRYSPSLCELRPWLIEHGIKSKPPSAFDLALFKMGQSHESAHLKTFKNYTDGKDIQEAISDPKTDVIYRPVFTTNVKIDGEDFDFTGRPNFLIRSKKGWIIRDVSIATRVSKKEKPQIWLQLQSYAYLFNQCFDETLAGLEVYSGRGEIIEIDYDGEDVFLEELARYVSLVKKTNPKYEPVGYSKCQGCGFKDGCWEKAEKAEDVAIVYGLNQEAAKSLYQEGIKTISELVEVDEVKLSAIRHASGGKQRKIGKVAGKILSMAKSMKTGDVVVHSDLNLPTDKNMVMFDLEGIPSFLGKDDRQYLWGFQVFGKDPGEYKGCLAGFGRGDDKEVWELFLREAADIFKQYGDIPWVHYSSYEKTQLKQYVKRYGDVKGVAERVLNNLFDLLPAINKSVSVPLSSYSLKVVEKYVGFERKLKGFVGEDSMASYLDAVDAGEGLARDEIMKEILLYNEEDLMATWAVFEWAKGLGRG